jgi:tyrosine-protein phosphatase YwqE
MMGSFFELFRKSDRLEYFPIQVDMHSHILPGIDDGSPDLETSISLVKGLMRLGVKGAVATPHIIGDLYRNDESSISAAFRLLEQELKTREVDFKLSFAAEYMLDSYFMELLDSGVSLLTVKDNLILTEFSYLSRPQHVEDISFRIQTEGYIPILAHPERYQYFHSSPGIYSHFIDIGFKLQVNLLSLTGIYGNATRKAARYIIDNDLASFIGTDLHHQRHLDALSKASNQRMFQKILGRQSWNTELSI